MDPRPHPQTRPNTALLVGTDEVLLYTRKAILEKLGFSVSVMEPHSAIADMDRSDPDIIVACHTLTSEEAQSLVRAARAQPTKPALIGFTKGFSSIFTSHLFDASVWSLANPETFVREVQQVLSQRQH